MGVDRPTLAHMGIWGGPTTCSSPRKVGSYLDVPLEVRSNGDRINGLFHPLINGVYWGYNPLILTFY